METKSLLRKYLGTLGSTEDLPEDDQELIATGIIDSLGILKLVSFIEEKFGITVSDEDLIPEHFQTLNDIYELIENKRMALQES